MPPACVEPSPAVVAVGIAAALLIDEQRPAVHRVCDPAPEKPHVAPPRVRKGPADGRAGATRRAPRVAARTAFARHSWHEHAQHADASRTLRIAAPRSEAAHSARAR